MANDILALRGSVLRAWTVIAPSCSLSSPRPWDLLRLIAARGRELEPRSRDHWMRPGCARQAARLASCSLLARGLALLGGLDGCMLRVVSWMLSRGERLGRRRPDRRSHSTPKSAEERDSLPSGRGPRDLLKRLTRDYSSRVQPARASVPLPRWVSLSCRRKKKIRVEEA